MNATIVEITTEQARQAEIKALEEEFQQAQEELKAAEQVYAELRFDLNKASTNLWAITTGYISEIVVRAWQTDEHDMVMELENSIECLKKKAAAAELKMDEMKKNAVAAEINFREAELMCCQEVLKDFIGGRKDWPARKAVMEGELAYWKAVAKALRLKMHTVDAHLEKIVAQVGMLTVCIRNGLDASQFSMQDPNVVEKVAMSIMMQKAMKELSKHGLQHLAGDIATFFSQYIRKEIERWQEHGWNEASESLFDLLFCFSFENNPDELIELVISQYFLNIGMRNASLDRIDVTGTLVQEMKNQSGEGVWYFPLYNPILWFDQVQAAMQYLPLSLDKREKKLHDLLKSHKFPTWIAGRMHVRGQIALIENPVHALQQFLMQSWKRTGIDAGEFLYWCQEELGSPVINMYDGNTISQDWLDIYRQWLNGNPLKNMYTRLPEIHMAVTKALQEELQQAESTRIQWEREVELQAKESVKKIANQAADALQQAMSSEQQAHKHKAEAAVALASAKVLEEAADSKLHSAIKMRRIWILICAFLVFALVFATGKIPCTMIPSFLSTTHCSLTENSIYSVTYNGKRFSTGNLQSGLPPADVSVAIIVNDNGDLKEFPAYNINGHFYVPNLNN